MTKAKLPHSLHPRVVIIGGGFGGLTLAKKLRKLPYQVVLLDRNNYHTFQPLLYQVATGGLEPDSIAFPLRKLFAKQDNLVFRMAGVERIDPDSKRLHTSIGEIEYDMLVLATGSQTNFFGMEQAEAHAVGMKTIPESLDLRSLILQNFESALLEVSEQEQDILMNFVVVGGGPTGVETAGALAELKRHILPADYPELDLDMMDIHLVEAGDQLLAGMSDKSGRDAKKALEKMGVHVWLNTLVKDVDAYQVYTDDGQTIDACTVIWAAGVKGNWIPGIDENLREGAHRLVVDRFHQVKGYPDIFVIGDLAYMEEPDYPQGHPQVAPAAIQQAENLGRNLKNRLRNKPPKPFSYFDKGSMATIGRNKAVVDFRKLHLKGFIAWLSWMFLHLFYLIGFRNRMVVFVNWVWSYFTYDKGTRLIIRPFPREERAPSQEKASL